MKGSIIKRSSTYSIVYDIGKDNNGKRKQKWESGFRTKKEAQETLTKRLYEIQNGTYVNADKTTLSEYLNKWFDSYVKVNCTASTARGYRVNIENHIIPTLGNLPLSKLQPVQVQELYNKKIEQGLSPSTVIYIHRVLHKALGQAVKLQMLNRNVTEFVDVPKRKKYHPTVLNEQQVIAMLKKAKDTGLYIPILLGVTLGLRRGEVLGLRWKDINWEEKTVSILQAVVRENKRMIISETKTESSRRTLLVSDDLLNTLKKHRIKQNEYRLIMGKAYKDHDLIVCKEDGDIYNISYLNKRFKEFMRKCSLPEIRFHDLRHTNATLMLSKGIHAKVASQRLGHSTIGITMDLYSHVLKEMQEEAANLIKGY